jgi:hypothetical protein
MEFLQWMFQDFWHFIGMIILISVVGTCINGFIKALNRMPGDEDE